MFVCFKKVRELLFVFSLMGLTFAPVTAWSMEEEIESSWLPDELWVHTFSYLDPLKWSRMGEVSKLWNRASHEVFLEGFKTGKRSMDDDRKAYRETLAAFENFAQAFPGFQQHIVDKNKQPAEFPTVQSYKYFYLAQHLNGLSQRELDPDRAHQLKIKSSAYMHKAYDEGNPYAVRSYSRLSKILENAYGHERFSKRHFEFTDEPRPSMDVVHFQSSQLEPVLKYVKDAFENCQKCQGWPKTHTRLTWGSAFYGSSLASARVMNGIVSGLEKNKWKGGKLPQNDLNALINLGNSWPNGREMLLLHAFDLKELSDVLFSPSRFHRYCAPCLEYDNREIYIEALKKVSSQLEAIGKGREINNFFGHTVNLKWPEAFRLLGKCHIRVAIYDQNLINRDRFNESITTATRYFGKACKGGDEKAPFFLGRLCGPFPGNKEGLEEIVKRYPTSVVALSTLGKIMIDEIPDNVDSTHENVQDFLTFFRKARCHLNEKSDRLPAHNRHDSRGQVLWCMECIEKPDQEFFEEALAEALRDEESSHMSTTALSFLDEVVPTLTPLTESDAIGSLIYDYFGSKWGADFVRTGKLQKGADRGQWSERDSLYGFRWFSLLDNFKRIEFCKIVMGSSLKGKKEASFVKAYEMFCETSNEEPVGITNYRLLEAKNRQFNKVFPDNNEVENLFKELPVPEQKQKRKSSAAEDPRPLKRKKGERDDEQEGK